MPVIAGQGSSYQWAPILPLLADAAGNCSMLVSTNDNYTNNQATIAGGAIFSTDWNTTNSLCSPYSLLQLSEQRPGCGISAWQNNSAGYGSSLAYPPSKLLLNAPPFLTYVSNSLDTLPMSVWALDQAGTRVDLGMDAHKDAHNKANLSSSKPRAQNHAQNRSCRSHNPKHKLPSCVNGPLTLTWNSQ